MQLFRTKGQKFLHCPGTTGQAQNLAKGRNGTRDGTGRDAGRDGTRDGTWDGTLDTGWDEGQDARWDKILTAVPSLKTNSDRAEKDVLKQEKDVLKQEKEILKQEIIP